MTITLNGTTGITDVNGTAAAPAITGTDTDSGMYFGTNTVSLATGGTAAVTVDSSQNVAITGITTVAAGSAALPAIVSTTGTADTGLWFPAADTVAFSTAGSERARIDSSGNVGIGSTSVTSKLDVVSTSGTYSGGIRVNGNLSGNNQSGMYIVGCQSTAQYNWLIGSQFNLGNTFEITPSTAVNGTTFSTPRFALAQNGVVTMSVYTAGTATFSAAGVISSVSDETWKIKDGVPVDTDSMLKKLEPGYWYYNDEKKEIFGVDRQLGFYAQNVNAAIGPEAAPTPEEGKPWGYYDRSVLAITVMSLQKALATIESLTDRIAALEAR